MIGRQNIVILTSGLTGSSVLAGFLAQSGYWAGDATHRKEYDTFENRELIELDRKIFEQAGFTGNYITESSESLPARIRSLYGKVDDTIYRQFLTKCDEHRPWVWKDPRLWLTIHFWKNLLNPDDCRFILLSRDYLQAWISGTLRRQIINYRAFRRQEEHIESSVRGVLDGNNLPYFRIRYDDLIARPEETIHDMSRFLGASLSVKDLEAIYHKPLRKSPKASAVNSVKALLIYFKNYSARTGESIRKT